MPAASWPRCWSTVRPSKMDWLTLDVSSARSRPMIPHMMFMMCDGIIL
jgi:hypothetical protein